MKIEIIQQKSLPVVLPTPHQPIMSTTCNISFNFGTMSTKNLEEIRANVNRILAARRPLSSVSYLNRLMTKDHMKYEYKFVRETNNDGLRYWNCFLTYRKAGDDTLHTWGCDINKKKAKQVAASEMRLFFDEEYSYNPRDYDKQEIEAKFIDPIEDDDEYEDDFYYSDEDKESPYSLSEDERYMSQKYTPIPVESDYDSDYNGSDLDETDRSPRVVYIHGLKDFEDNDDDSTSNPEWMSEWKNMNDGEKKEFLDKEIDEYTNETIERGKYLSNLKECVETLQNLPWKKEILKTISESNESTVSGDWEKYVVSLPLHTLDLNTSDQNVIIDINDDEWEMMI